MHPTVLFYFTITVFLFYYTTADKSSSQLQNIDLIQWIRSHEPITKPIYDIYDTNQLHWGFHHLHQAKDKEEKDKEEKDKEDKDKEEKDLSILMVIPSNISSSKLELQLKPLLQSYIQPSIEVILVADSFPFQSIFTFYNPSVQRVQVPKNAGFFERANIGARHARGSWIVVTNPHVKFSEALADQLFVDTQSLHTYDKNTLYSSAQVPIEDCDGYRRKKSLAVAPIDQFMLMHRSNMYKFGGFFLDSFSFLTGKAFLEKKGEKKEEENFKADEFLYRSIHRNRLHVDFIHNPVCVANTVIKGNEEEKVGGRLVNELYVRSSWYPKQSIGDPKSCDQIDSVADLVEILNKGFIPASMYKRYALNEVEWGLPLTTFEEFHSSFSKKAFFSSSSKKAFFFKNEKEKKAFLEKEKKKNLSIIVTSRNDNDARVQRLMNCIRQFLFFPWQHASIEFILVEWNGPSPGRSFFNASENLTQILNHEHRSSHVDFRIIHVPPKIAYEPNLEGFECPIFEFPAKNVGIRRAQGSYILTINADDVFSHDLMLSLDNTFISSSSSFFSKDALPVKKQKAFLENEEEGENQDENQWLEPNDFVSVYRRGVHPSQLINNTDQYIPLDQSCQRMMIPEPPQTVSASHNPDDTKSSLEEELLNSWSILYQDEWIQGIFLRSVHTRESYENEGKQTKSNSRRKVPDAKERIGADAKERRQVPNAKPYETKKCKVERTSRDVVNIGDFQLISKDNIFRNFGGGFLELPQSFSMDSEWLARQIHVNHLDGKVLHCKNCHQIHSHHFWIRDFLCEFWIMDFLNC